MILSPAFTVSFFSNEICLDDTDSRAEFLQANHLLVGVLYVFGFGKEYQTLFPRKGQFDSM